MSNWFSEHRLAYTVLSERVIEYEQSAENSARAILA